MDKIVAAINSFKSAILSFFDPVVNVFNVIGDCLSYIWSFITTLFFGLVSMLSSVYELIVQLFNSGLF